METNQHKKNNVRIAVVGCLHGHIKELYDDIKFQDEKEGKKTDLVLCCGDFQSIRNHNDLNYMSCPDKFKNLGQFHHYYSGKWEVPYLTIFIGGNHEASNVLEENYYGGWIMEKVFYLGKSGLINYKGITIAGLSGIFKPNDYFKGHYELDLIRCIKSVYHVREFELVKLAAIEKDIDIFMSHDWPTSVVNPKDFNRILKIKSFWAEELKSNSLGSPVSFYLMNSLRPTYWFSGHMHYYYENTISFASENFNNEEEKKIETHFIALDKPVQRRKYFSIIEYTPKNLDKIIDENIYFDLDWLAITKTFNEYFPINSSNYDFSDFLKNKKDYLNLLNEYNLLSFNISNKTKINPNNFYKKLEENRNDFKNEIKWEITKEKSQREYVIEILNMPDFHKTKDKTAFKDSINEIKKDNNLIENICFDYRNEINMIKINKNSEELDVDIDFV